MNPSIIVIASNQPFTQNIVDITYYIEGGLLTERVTGIHKLHKDLEDNDTSYLCWQAEESLVSEKPSYFSKLSFREPIDSNLQITEIWLCLTNRYTKGYKVKSIIDRGDIYLDIVEVIEESLD
jgi:hypothetical protein